MSTSDSSLQVGKWSGFIMCNKCTGCLCQRFDHNRFIPHFEMLLGERQISAEPLFNSIVSSKLDCLIDSFIYFHWTADRQVTNGSLEDWISDTLSQEYTNLPSLVAQAVTSFGDARECIQVYRQAMIAVATLVCETHKQQQKYRLLYNSMLLYVACMANTERCSTRQRLYQWWIVFKTGHRHRSSASREWQLLIVCPHRHVPWWLVRKSNTSTKTASSNLHGLDMLVDALPCQYHVKSSCQVACSSNSMCWQQYIHMSNRRWMHPYGRLQENASSCKSVPPWLYASNPLKKAYSFVAGKETQLSNGI